MKRVFIFLTSLLSFSGVTPAQWVIQTTGVTADLEAMYFANKNTAWIVGTGGTILKTANAGNTWATQISGTLGNFYSVNFLNVNIGYTLGGNRLLKTTNGGATWTSQSLSIPTASNATISPSLVWFTDTNTGYVAGGITTVTSVPPKTFHDPSGFCVKTTNGGNTWPMATAIGYTNSLNSLNANVVYSVGGGCYRAETSPYFTSCTSNSRKTTNGGNTWSKFSFSSGIVLRSAYFLDTNTGYAVGYNTGSNTSTPTGRTIQKTINSGATWSTIYSSSGASLNGVYFVNANMGWVVGDGGIILKTTNGGISWGLQISGTTNDLMAVHFIDTSTGYIIGTGGVILKTTNGGSAVTFISATKGAKQNFEIKGQNLFYNLPRTSPVQALIFDSHGRLALKLSDVTQLAGEHVVDLSALKLLHGQYFLDFRSDGMRKTIEIQ